MWCAKIEEYTKIKTCYNVIMDRVQNKQIIAFCTVMSITVLYLGTCIYISNQVLKAGYYAHEYAKIRHIYLGAFE